MDMAGLFDYKASDHSMEKDGNAEPNIMYDWIFVCRTDFFISDAG